jgi:hypothetical protein
MGYYRGDYYRGDYYRGDPGIFSSIGKFIGGAAKLVGGIVPGPAGAVLRGGGGAIQHFAGGGPRLPMIAPPSFGGSLAMQGEPGKVLVGGGGAGVPLRPMIGTTPRGLHPNKSTYVTRGGGTSHWPMQLLVHPAHTENVRNRRMNVGNAKALRRSLHRIAGFAHLARRVMRFVHPKAGRGQFKFPRRKRK